MVEFTVLPSFKDYQAANWFMFRRNWLCAKSMKRIVVFIGFIFVLHLLLYGFRGAGFTTFSPVTWLCSSLLISTAWFGFCAFLQAISLPKGFRKSYDQSPTIRLPTTYVLTDKGLTFRNDRVTANFEWSFFESFLESQRFFVLLAVSRQGFYLFPKNQLDHKKSHAVKECLQSASQTYGIKHFGS